MEILTLHHLHNAPTATPTTSSSSMMNSKKALMGSGSSTNMNITSSSLSITTTDTSPHSTITTSTTAPNSIKSVGPLLYTCMRCFTKHPFEELDFDLMQCRSCNSSSAATSSIATTNQISATTTTISATNLNNSNASSAKSKYSICQFCREEFQPDKQQMSDVTTTNGNNNSNKDNNNSLPATTTVCGRCTRNVAKFGTPRSCENCNIVAAFSGKKCQRCFNYQQKYGEPDVCSSCKLRAAFYCRDKPAPKEKLFCYLCSRSRKRLQAKSDAAAAKRAKLRSSIPSASSIAKRDVTSLKSRLTESTRLNLVSNNHAFLSSSASSSTASLQNGKSSSSTTTSTGTTTSSSSSSSAADQFTNLMDIDRRSTNIFDSIDGYLSTGDMDHHLDDVDDRLFAKPNTESLMKVKKKLSAVRTQQQHLEQSMLLLTGGGTGAGNGADGEGDAGDDGDGGENGEMVASIEKMREKVSQAERNLFAREQESAARDALIDELCAGIAHERADSDRKMDECAKRCNDEINDLQCKLDALIKEAEAVGGKKYKFVED